MKERLTILLGSLFGLFLAGTQSGHCLPISKLTESVGIMSSLAASNNSSSHSSSSSVELPAAGEARLSEVGAEFPRELTLEEWRGIGRKIQRCDRALNWIRGDWFNAGRRFIKGQGACSTEEDLDRLAVAIGQLVWPLSETEQRSLWHYAYVARRVRACTRVQELSWSHHREVAALAEGQQRRWLGMALAKGWSVADLREALAGTERAAPAAPVAAFVPGAVVSSLVRWFAAEESRIELAVDKWPTERRKALKADLAPLVKLYERL